MNIKLTRSKKKNILSIVLLILTLMLVIPIEGFGDTSLNVFLNGQNGNDTRDGTSPSTAVKTFAEAKSKLAPGGTIWITGQVTINANETWDLNGYGEGGAGEGVIKRWDGVSVPFTLAADKTAYKNTLVYVNDSKRLDLNNIIFDGNKDNVIGSSSGNVVRTLGDLYIDNCTFQNSKAPTSGTAITGRLGSATSYRGTINIQNSKFLGNEGTEMGYANGTIAYDKGNVVINKSIFEDNLNARSGVICSAFKTGITDRTLTVTDCSFQRNNTVLALGNYDTATVKNTTISENDTTIEAIISVNAANVTLEDCTITDNTNTRDGTIYLTNPTAVVNVIRTDITGNSTNLRGGGIFLNSGTVNIKDSNIKNNTAGTLGAGLFYYTGTLNVEGTNDISGNTSSETKGDVYLSPYRTITVVDDLTGSNIGVLTGQKPVKTSIVDVALPATGYTMPNTYYEQFFANDPQARVRNEIYNTDNNKVVIGKAHHVTFSSEDGGTLSGADPQFIDYGDTAKPGVTGVLDSPEYVFIGWMYDYISDSGAHRDGTVSDYTTVPIEGEVEFRAMIAKKPFISASADIGGLVSVSKKGDKKPTQPLDYWEIDKDTDPMPVDAVVEYTVPEGYELKNIKFKDLYGKEYTIDLTKTEAQTFEVGEEEPFSEVSITYDQDNKKVYVNNVNTSLEFEVNYKKANNSIIKISNTLSGDLANYNDVGHYTLTGTMDGEFVTEEYELKNGESIEVDGFDEGSEYTVTQTPMANYTTTIDTESTIDPPTVTNLEVKGVFNAEGTVTIAYTNTMNAVPLSGISSKSDGVALVMITAMMLMFISSLVMLRFKKSS